MKVLLLMRRFPPVSFGGGELSALQLVKGLISRGLDVTVLTGREHPGTDDLPLDMDHPGGLEIRADINANGSHNEKRWVREARKSLRPLDSGFDLIHVHDPMLIPPAIDDRSIPVVATINDMRPTCYYSMHFRRGAECPECSLSGLKECLSDWGGSHLMARSILKATRARTEALNQLDGMIPRSKQVEKVLRDNGVTVPSFICPPLVQGPFETSDPPGRGIVGYLGRIDRGKGIDTAIRAIASVEGIKLKIIGEGPYLNEYKDLCREIGVSERVEFTGKISYEMVPNELSGLDIVLIPSSRLEAMPRTIIESAHASRPVIVSDATGGNEFVVHGETGFLFKAGSPESLADVLNDAVGSDLIEMGRKALAHAESDYDLNSIISGVISFYLNILNSRSR